MFIPVGYLINDMTKVTIPFFFQMTFFNKGKLTLNPPIIKIKNIKDLSKQNDKV